MGSATAATPDDIEEAPDFARSAPPLTADESDNVVTADESDNVASDVPMATATAKRQARARHP